MIALENETSVRVKAGTAVEIACVSGVLWVTQEGDVRDMFLAPGESLRLAGRGLTIVTALEPSLVRLIEDAKPSEFRRLRRSINVAQKFIVVSVKFGRQLRLELFP